MARKQLELSGLQSHSTDIWIGWHSVENLKSFVEKALAPNQVKALEEGTLNANEQLQTVANSGQRRRLHRLLEDITIQTLFFKESFQLLETFVIERVTQQGIFPPLGYIWFSLLLAEVMQHHQDQGDTKTADDVFKLFYDLVDLSSETYPNLAFSMYGVFQAKRSVLSQQSSDFLLKQALEEVLPEPTFGTDEKATKTRTLQAAVILKIQSSMKYWEREISADDWNQVRIPVRITTVASEYEQQQQYPSRVTDEPDTVMLLDENTLPSFEKIGLGVETGVPNKGNQTLVRRIVPATLGVQVQSDELGARGTQFFTYYDLPAVPTVNTENEDSVEFNVLNLSTDQVLEILATKRIERGTLGSLQHLAAIRLRDNIFTRLYNLYYNDKKKSKVPDFDNILPAEQLAFQRELATRKLKLMAKAIAQVADELTKELSQQLLVNTDGSTTVRNSMIAQAFIDEYGLLAFEDAQTADAKTKQWAHIERVILEEVMTTALQLAVGVTSVDSFYDEQYETWRKTEEPFLEFTLFDREKITQSVKENWIRSLSENEKVSFSFVMLLDIGNQQIDFPPSLRQKLIVFRNQSRDSISRSGALAVPELSDEETAWLLDYFERNTHKISLRWQTIRNKSITDVDTDIDDVM